MKGILILLGTCVVIRFEQFVFEFLFVLETSQTIHSLKVDKIKLIVLKWNCIKINTFHFLLHQAGSTPHS